MSEAAPLTDAQARRYGQYPDQVSDEQLRRFFRPSPADRTDIARMRSASARLGYSVQLGTVRFLGCFPSEPERTPESVLAFVAGELGLSPGDWKTYLAKRRTRFVHQDEICERHGFIAFGQGPQAWGFGRFLWRRAWTGTERPSLLIDLATAWLVDHRVLLPGITTLTRVVGRIRERTARRSWRLLNAQLTPAATTRLQALLELDSGGQVSRLQRLRQPPRSRTIDGLVAALERLAEIQALYAETVDVSGIPAARIKALADDASADGCSASPDAEPTGARPLSPPSSTSSTAVPTTMPLTRT